LRNFLNPIKNEPAENMPSKLKDGKLVVELGTSGLGPALVLEFIESDGKDFLIPEIQMGLYDDYEDDLGVGWIFPLSRFERI